MIILKSTISELIIFDMIIMSDIYNFDKISILPSFNSPTVPLLA